MKNISFEGKEGLLIDTNEGVIALFEPIILIREHHETVLDRETGETMSVITGFDLLTRSGATITTTSNEELKALFDGEASETDELDNLTENVAAVEKEFSEMKVPKPPKKKKDMLNMS